MAGYMLVIGANCGRTSFGGVRRLLDNVIDGLYHIGKIKIN